jgi:MSHA biogenesis protein MshL
MKVLTLMFTVVLLTACAEQPARRDGAEGRTAPAPERTAPREMQPAAPEAVSQALLPPLVVEMPRVEGVKPFEQRFDLNVNHAPAAQVFMAIVSGTRYSMIVHPDVREPVSVNLKDVTVVEALDTLRELYGYDYRMLGQRITVLPLTLQSRVYKVNYLQASRAGRSDLRVPAAQAADASTTAAGAASRPADSARVTTSSDGNFWGDLARSLNTIVGAAEGRSVTVNPQSGVIVVRALPAELRSVESFLKAMQLIVERQVVLEAKILDVLLREGREDGINWSAFRDAAAHAAAARNPDRAAGAEPALTAGLVGGAPRAIFGLPLRTGDFNSLMSFLETQGAVSVLASPRVSTLNNQKAVLKGGTDDYFVTNVSAAAAAGSRGPTLSPTITVQPFFSGVALDVTPQIDDGSHIILHVHPQVSRVTEQRKVVDLGALGVFTLPLASASVNEADAVVRVQDGHIVVIGGLLRQDGAAAGGEASRQRGRGRATSELVILLRPTIVPGTDDSRQDPGGTGSGGRTPPAR